MKLEIEITEDEIRGVIERKVRAAVADMTNQWSVDSFIKASVREHWDSTVGHLVVERLNDSDTLRAKISAEIEKKIRAQLAAAIKISAKAKND